MTTTIRSSHSDDGLDSEWLVNQIAHALRNPIFAALVQAEALVLKAGEREDIARSANMVLGQLKRLEGDIDEMLLLGRLAKKNIRRADLTPVLNGLTEAFRVGLHSEPAEVRLHMDPGPFEITGDPDAIQLILERLLRNAVEHTDPPHIVDLEVDRPTADTVRLTVRDHGHGIADELHEQVFVPFYPQHAGRPGLGLSVAAKFAHAMSGRIELETEKDEGTVARVFLPADADQAGP